MATRPFITRQFHKKGDQVMADETCGKMVGGNITDANGEMSVKRGNVETKFAMPVIPCPFGGMNGTHRIEPPAYDREVKDGDSSEVTVNAGFPAAFSTALTQGGNYVQRADVNGMGYLATLYHFFSQCGGIMQYDANVAKAIGGYPPGAVLAYLSTKEQVVTDGSNTQVYMYNNEMVYVKNISASRNSANFRDGTWTGWKICTLARRELDLVKASKQNVGNYVTTDTLQSGMNGTKGWTGKHTFSGGVDISGGTLAMTNSAGINAKNASSVTVPTPTGTNYDQHNGDYAASIKWVRNFHAANDQTGGGGGTSDIESEGQDGFSYYRIWKSGWVDQYGYESGLVKAQKFERTVSTKVSTPYSAVVTLGTGGAGDDEDAWWGCDASSRSLKIMAFTRYDNYANTGKVFWEVHGMG